LRSTPLIAASVDVALAAVAAACARPPRAAAPSSGLAGRARPQLGLPARSRESAVPHTDAQWRAVGREAAALSPFPLTPAESRGVHGTDERVSLDALTFGVHVMYDVVATLVAK
jgi:acetylornithine deacetylase/succinyl-diaminopimelate desuccinylase-like protein